MVAVGAVCYGASTASALAAPSTCPEEPLTQPFTSFGDDNSYFLIPDGGLIGGGIGWTFSGGAQVVSDPASPSGFAAEIPSGATVTTPLFCVSKNAPTARMFAVTSTPVRKHENKALTVTILYSNDHGPKRVGHLDQMDSWGPTREISLAPGQVRHAGGSAMVQYEFSVSQGATWRIADVYVDPHMKH
jgi:hypothetical protein